jgi:GNAT superfamily N-acetyltransferase
MNAGLQVAEVHATSSSLPALVALFEGYRSHYGSPGSVTDARAWLVAQLDGGGLRGYIAHLDRVPAGMALVASAPASLRLGHYWQLRDLYVAEQHRRQGVGRALLAHVRDEASADGALRVSLTTEADNAGALALYGDVGFEPVDGYVSMALGTEEPPSPQQPTLVDFSEGTSRGRVLPG